MGPLKKYQFLGIFCVLDVKGIFLIFSSYDFFQMHFCYRVDW